jgi:hypothetical protein
VVVGLLAAELDTPPSLSILKLQGLGKEFWQGVDIAVHVQTERIAGLIDGLGPSKVPSAA